MNYAIEMPENNTKKNVIMQMYGSYKFILWAMGGVLLSVPIWHDVPVLMGWVGLVVAVIGAVAQMVKIVNDRAEEKRRQEVHAAKMRIFEAQMAAGKLEEAGEVWG